MELKIKNCHRDAFYIVLGIREFELKRHTAGGPDTALLHWRSGVQSQGRVAGLFQGV